jgi:hypothetical protein
MQACNKKALPTGRALKPENEKLYCREAVLLPEAAMLL